MSSFSVVVVVVIRPLPRDRDMAKDHGAPEAGKLPGPESKIVERQKVAKERATLKVRSWTAQNEMRGVLGRMTAGAA